MGQTSDPPTVHECGCEICRKFRENNVDKSQVEKDAYKRRHQETFDRHQAINRLMANTDERNRRMIAGLVSRLLMPPAKDEEGKIKDEETAPLGKTAIITGLSPRTIRVGWRELKREHYAVALDKVTPPRRARRKGGGRKRAQRSG
jgi:hypothetical protein